MSRKGKQMTCYCGSTYDFSACCNPFLKGDSYPETAEALMRSRFSAFSLRQPKYIQTTMKAPALTQFDLASFLADSIQYVSLNIISCELGLQLDDIGFVTFKVCYKVSTKDT